MFSEILKGRGRGDAYAAAYTGYPARGGGGFRGRVFDEFTMLFLALVIDQLNFFINLNNDHRNNNNKKYIF